MQQALTDDQIQSFREDLCDHALRICAERGPDGVTMRRLANELGVSAMTPYRYFESKDAILRAARARAFERFGARCQEAIAGISDPVARFRALCRSYVAFALESPHDYRMMFQLDQAPDLEVAPSGGAWTTLHDTLAEAVDKGQMRGDPAELAHLAWFSVHGAVSLHLAGRLRNGKTLDELIEPLAEHFLTGAGTAHESAARPAEDER